MNFRITHFLFLFMLFIGGFFGLRSYHYFFDSHKPDVSLVGIEDKGYYANEVQCVLNAQDLYKVADISVWLDGKLLINKFKINASSCEHPFFISTRTLTNGAHTLKAEAINGTYKQNKTIKEVAFFVDNTPLQAALVRPESEYKVFQGRTLHVQFQINKEIKSATVNALSTTYPAFQEAKNSPIYECFIPIACEEVPNEYLSTISIADHVGNSLVLEAKFHVVAFQFKKQTLTIDPTKAQEEKEAGLAAAQLELDLEKLIAQSPQKKLWQGIFYPHRN